jgi:hypothetical protein
MKIFFNLLFICCFLIVALSCNEAIKSNSESLKSDTLNKTKKNNKEYVYFIINTNEPIITSQIVDINKEARIRAEKFNKDMENVISNDNYSTDYLMPKKIESPSKYNIDVPLPEFKKMNTQTNKYHFYTSEIKEFENNDIDEIYKSLDQFEDEIKSLLYNADIIYNNKNETNRVSKIIDRNFKKFKTYSEASIDKSNFQKK